MNLRFVRLHHRDTVTRDTVTRDRSHPTGVAGWRRVPSATGRRGRLLFSLVLAAVLLVVGSCRLHGQEWRTVDVARQLRDTLPVAIKVQYAAGHLAVGAAPAPLLYRMQLRYDASRSAPMTGWDTTSRTATLGASAAQVSWRTGRSSDAGRMVLGLARSVPIALSIDVGAAEATLDLSGLWLSSLDVRCGASETTLRFATPSAHPLDHVTIETGAAHFSAAQFANSGARSVLIRGALTLVELDLTGSWQRDMQLDLELSLGKAELTVPVAVGVRVTPEGGALSAGIEGLTKVGAVWETDGFAAAAHKLTVRSRATISGISVVRR